MLAVQQQAGSAPQKAPGTYDDHVLEIIHEEVESDLLVCRLKDPRYTKMQSTTLVFADDQITITGDLCPGGWNGVISSCGYGVGWFAGELSSGYLCGKFLEKEFIPDLACEELVEILRTNPGEHTREQRDEMREAIRDWSAYHAGPCEEGGQFHELWERIGYDGCDMGGIGFDRNAARLLVEIHEAFRRLWMEREPAPEIPDEHQALADACEDYLDAVGYDDYARDGYYLPSIFAGMAKDAREAS